MGSEGEKCYRRFTNTPIVNIALFSQSSRFLGQKHPVKKYNRVFGYQLESGVP